MVRWARRRAGMTQVELAQACGMPQSTIVRIERGAVVPRSATLVELLRATGYELNVERTIGSGLDPDPIRERLRLPPPTRVRRSLGSTPARLRPLRILWRLRRFGVRFVLIGGLAESAHGAPESERAVEVCHALDPENLERLAMALTDIGAAAVDPNSRRREVVKTDAGRLQLDPEPIIGDDFDVLARNAKRMLVGTGLLVSVAALDDLIRIRRSRGRPEDRRALDVLGAVRDEIDRA